MNILLTLAFRNLLRHRRKSLLLSTLVAGGIGLLFVASALFESSNRGLEASYVGSLTGDLAVGAASDTASGLFGSEIPIASEYETIPPLSDFETVRAKVETEGLVASWTPLVSAAAKLQVGAFSQAVPVFGVEGKGYFRTLPSLTILRGDPEDLSRGGVFLNEAIAQKAEKTLKRPLRAGETVTFSTYSGGSFRIRTGIFAGIYAYPSRSEALDRLVLVDPTLARGLADYTLGYASAASVGKGGDTDTDTETAGGDLDSLFDASADRVLQDGPATSLEAVSAALADTSGRDALVLTDRAAWSFVLLRAKEGKAKALGRELSSFFRSKEAGARVLDWRGAAGSSAQALFALQAVFYVAMGFIALGAILVIMNSLVISVLERTGEIGTMRGLGAGRGFIRGLFVAESLALTLAGGIAGILLGTLLCLIIGAFGSQVANPLLAALFGGGPIRPLLTSGAYLLHLGLALAVGATAWIYPVAVAIRIQPSSAMGR